MQRDERANVRTSRSQEIARVRRKEELRVIEFVMDEKVTAVVDGGACYRQVLRRCSISFGRYERSIWQ